MSAAVGYPWTRRVVDPLAVRRRREDGVVDVVRRARPLLLVPPALVVALALDQGGFDPSSWVWSGALAAWAAATAAVRGASSSCHAWRGRGSPRHVRSLCGSRLVALVPPPRPDRARGATHRDVRRSCSRSSSSCAAGPSATCSSRTRRDRRGRCLRWRATSRRCSLDRSRARSSRNRSAITNALAALAAIGVVLGVASPLAHTARVVVLPPPRRFPCSRRHSRSRTAAVRRSRSSRERSSWSRARTTQCRWRTAIVIAPGAVVAALVAALSAPQRLRVASPPACRMARRRGDDRLCPPARRRSVACPAREPVTPEGAAACPRRCARDRRDRGRHPYRVDGTARIVVARRLAPLRVARRVRLGRRDVRARLGAVGPHRHTRRRARRALALPRDARGARRRRPGAPARVPRAAARPARPSRRRARAGRRRVHTSSSSSTRALDWDWEMPAVVIAGLCCGAAALAAASESAGRRQFARARADRRARTGVGRGLDRRRAELVRARRRASTASPGRAWCSSRRAARRRARASRASSSRRAGSSRAGACRRASSAPSVPSMTR